MLVDARLMRKSIAADDCFIRLHVKPDNAREQLARRIKLSGPDARLKRQAICAYVQRHHDLFERRVARALADAVDRTFDLSGPGFNRGETICDCEPEIVVAVNTDDHVVSISYDLLAHLLDQAR